MASQPTLLKNKLTLAAAAAAVASAAVTYRFVPAVQEAGVWALITVACGAFTLLMAAGSLLLRETAWTFAIQAAVMAGVTLAAGAAGTASGRRSTDEQAEYVAGTMLALDRDAEVAAIHTTYVKATGYAAARRCTLLGLGLGVPGILLAMAALRKAGRKGDKSTSSLALYALWSWPAVVGGVLGVVAVRNPVPAAQDPEAAQIALMQRRFGSGDEEGACRILERVVQVTLQASEQAVAARIADLPARASKCVELEVAKARKLGASGCEVAREQWASKRFVQLSGKQEQAAEACSGLEPQP